MFAANTNTSPTTFFKNIFGGDFSIDATEAIAAEVKKIEKTKKAKKRVEKMKGLEESISALKTIGFTFDETFTKPSSEVPEKKKLGATQMPTDFSFFDISSNGPDLLPQKPAEDHPGQKEHGEQLEYIIRAVKSSAQTLCDEYGQTIDDETMKKIVGELSEEYRSKVSPHSFVEPSKEEALSIIQILRELQDSYTKKATDSAQPLETEASSGQQQVVEEVAATAEASESNEVKIEDVITANLNTSGGDTAVGVAMQNAVKRARRVEKC